MAGEPYDYFGLMGGQANIGGAPEAVKTALFNNNLATQNQAQQFDLEKQHAALMQMYQDQQDQKALWGQLQANPNPKNTFAYISRFPQHAEPIAKAFQMLDGKQQEGELRTIADVTAMLDGGNNQAAYDAITAREAADHAAGLDTSQYSALKQMILQDPKTARGMAHLTLGAVAPDKYGANLKGISEAYTEDATRAPKVALTTAQAQEAGVKAQMAPQVIQSNLDTGQAQRQRMAAQTANEQADLRLKSEGLALDRDKFTSNMQLELMKLQQTGIKPEGDSLKLMNDAAASAVEANMLADRQEDLAARIKVADLGRWGNAREFLKATTGSQDYATQLRAEYTQVKNSAAVANRKSMPGAMSDADREFLLKGFPSDNAPGEYWARFLGVMAQAQRLVAKSEDRKAQWISANGSLGNAKGDINVAGTMIPRGTSFSEFMSTKPGQKGLPSGIGALAQKYGGK